MSELVKSTTTGPKNEQNESKGPTETEPKKKNEDFKKEFTEQRFTYRRLKSNAIHDSSFLRHEIKRQVTLHKQETIHRQISIGGGGKSHRVYPEEKAEMQRLVRSVTYKANRSFGNWLALKVKLKS